MKGKDEAAMDYVRKSDAVAKRVALGKKLWAKWAYDEVNTSALKRPRDISWGNWVGNISLMCEGEDSLYVDIMLVRIPLGAFAMWPK